MISKVKPLSISKITDLIKPEILGLILKGLSEEKRALVIEEMNGEEVERIPLPEEILSRYWTKICSYINRFPTGKNACENSSKNLAKEIIKENNHESRIYTCPLGLTILSIPFVFKGKVIGVLFGGKRRLKGTDINESLREFIANHERIIEEKAVYKEAEKTEWKDKKFSIHEAIKKVNSVEEISENDLEKEVKRYKEAAESIIKIGMDDYYAGSRLQNQQFLSDVMEYFLSVYTTGGIVLRDILRNIIEGITQFARMKYIIFIWEKDCFASSLSNLDIITTPFSTSAINETLTEFKELIEKQFENCNTACYSYITPNNPTVNKFDLLFGIKPIYSVYAKSITFRNQKEGLLIFVDPEVTENGFDEDCAEFLNLAAERIKSQIDIYLADEAKSEFIAEMTHRLKSPMQNIMDQSGYLEEYLKKEHPDDLKGNSIVYEIIDGVAHLDHQIKNYSYITTIDKEGGWSYDFQFHPIIVLVKKCVRRFRPSARSRGIKIITLLPEEDVGKRIEFDWDTIDIAVNNLLDNAVKYSHYNRDIFVQLSFNEKKRDWCISISNRGLGIYPDEYEKIFEKYYRSRSIRDPIRWIPGTGIGLSVVDKIVDAHQGKRMVTSELLKEKEKGDVYLTTFKIFLPYDRKGDS